MRYWKVRQPLSPRKVDLMSTTSFDEEKCHRAFREKVAAIYGWSTETGVMDMRGMFYLRLLDEIDVLSPGKHLLDLGAGTSAFGPVASALGMKVTIADDFGGGGGVDIEHLDATRKLIEGWKTRLGMNVLELDIITQSLPIETGAADVVTCINSLEHWHHSPKRLFREIVRVLRPHGYLILVTPNAANARKRISALLGRNIWDRLDWWYQDGDPVFRGHVREPIIADLKQIMEWNNIEPIKVYGRNYLGQHSKALGGIPAPVLRSGVALLDWGLRFFPTLCSDIHVIGRKRE
jgi:SAM-dependent methyltransferase